MEIQTKLKYKDGIFNIFVKKHLWIIPYWSLIYKTESKENAITTLDNLALISRRVKHNRGK